MEVHAIWLLVAFAIGILLGLCTPSGSTGPR
jgi:hypothetical protein